LTSCKHSNEEKELLDEFEQSGMTGSQFARTIGLKYQTFAFWQRACSSLEARQRELLIPDP
jgi:hypothetical protein